MSEAPLPINTALDRTAAALRDGHADEAERLVRDALARDPKNPRALYLLGVALLTVGRGAEAVAPFEALAQNGADAGLAANLAMALAQAGRLEDAATWLQRATADKPDFAIAYQKLGFILNMLSRDDEAEAALRRAVTLVPDDLESWLTLGQILLRRHEMGEARIAFSRVLQRHPDEPHAVHGLAWVMIEDGQFAQAAELFRALVARGAADPRLRIDLAYCLQELGRWEEAAVEYRAAVGSAPDLYARVLNAVVGAGRGRLWLKPSAAAKALGRAP
jgi:Flp pilus assembly protein TadD